MKQENILFENKGDAVDDKDIERGHQTRRTFVSDNTGGKNADESGNVGGGADEEESKAKPDGRSNV
jgi:hypothetical protein